MTTRRLAIVAWFALALPAGIAAQETPPRPRRAPTADQRAEMRERLEARFLDVAAERLELDGTQKARLAAVLEQSAESRRAVAEEGMRLRREAADLLRADTQDPGRAETLLGQLTRLKERELDLWRTEQQALAGILSPLQRLELMALQARLHQRVREVRGERAPRGARSGPALRGAPAAPRAPGQTGVPGAAAASGAGD